MRFRVLVAATAAAALCISITPSAIADKGDRAFPSKDRVAAAKERAEQKARDVGAIKASLLMANQRLEQAAVQAAQASEAYNGAMWRLQLAKEDVQTAKAEAQKAREAVADQRAAIGALVAASYQQSSDLTALGAMMSADGPEGVLDQYAAFHGASESLKADYDRYAASEALARVFERKAQEARATQEKLAQEANAAKGAATAAANAAQTAAAQITAEKDELIRELASAQNISVRLATKRQGALEEIAREQAASRARAEADVAARKQARHEAAVAGKARAAAKERAARARREQDQDRDRDKSKPAPAPSAPPAPAPPAPPPPAPSGSGGAQQAIAYAQAQLGEPYVWGAAGPDSWDCSGLTMAAWASAGVSLPHYSVAQYYTGTPISSYDLRPGDLVFWGSSSSPESIYHEGMYIGNGMMIHAPRTGRSVEMVSMYYWIPPNFFARV